KSTIRILSCTSAAIWTIAPGWPADGPAGGVRCVFLTAAGVLVKQALPSPAFSGAHGAHVAVRKPGWRGSRGGSVRAAAQNAEKKPVRVGPPRRHQQALLGEPHRAAEQIGTLAQDIRRAPRRFHREGRVVRGEAANLRAVLLVE